MANFNANDLLKKYEAGECTPEELALVEDYLINKRITEQDLLAVESDLYELQIRGAKIPEQPKRLNPVLRVAGWAAAILIVGGLAVLLFRSGKPQAEEYANDVEPGSNQATLTLANGKKINLTDVKNGELAVDRGVKIIKAADGQLTYVFDPNIKAAPARDSIPALVAVNEIPSNPYKGLNSVTTPKGGQYHIALPDGTNVWINAGSTLRFPSTFEGLAERRVLLLGEAYFEVSQIKTAFGMKKRARKMPFIVKTANQEVKVLGTHFNINCYTDEKDIKTTLLEGSVGITSPLLQAEETILEPGDQGINNGSVIKVKKVDTDEAVSWIKGEFVFRNEDLESIMRRVARWYNVEVVYENQQARKELFGGVLSRYDKISKVLHALEQTSDVKFRVTGKKVFVTM